MKTRSKIGQKLKRRTSILVILAILTISIPLIFLFSWNYVKNSVNNMNVISDQIVDQMNDSCKSVIQYAGWITTDKRLLSLIQEYGLTRAEEERAYYESLISNQLTELAGMSASIQDIVLLLEDGRVFRSVFIEDSDVERILSSDWYRKQEEENYLKFFYPDGPNRFTFCAPLESMSGLYGKIILTFRSDSLIQLIQTADKTFRHYLWLDAWNQPFYSGGGDTAFDYAPVLDHSARYRLQEDFILNRGSGIYITHISEVTRWKFIAFVPYHELLGNFFPIFIILIVSVLLVVLLASFILNPLIRNIIEPLEVLSQHMKKVPGGEEALVDIRTGDEIEDLSHAFNQMTLELQKHIRSLLENEKTKQQMKYGLLISQINPHFIYNTMNTINYLARKGRTGDIVVLNNALIRILKDSLRINDISVFDTVEQEIDVVKQYMTIQSCRYADQIRVFWEVKEDVLNFKIPKHIIQPIVENALLHGFLSEDLSGWEEEPFIRIKIYKEAFCLRNAPPETGREPDEKTDADQLVIRIEDNGVGIDMEQYRQLCLEADRQEENEASRGSHIGLANIRWRLNYLLKEEQSLTVEQASPHGTVVTIRIGKQA